MGTTSDAVMVTNLDRSYATDRSFSLEARDQLFRLSPETIYEQYGDVVLAWAAANADSDRASTLSDGLSALAGRDRQLLTKALRWTKEDLADRSAGVGGADVLTEYAVEDLIVNGHLEFSVADLLQAHALPGVEISESRARHYAIVPVAAIRNRPAGWVRETLAAYRPNTYFSVRLDAPTGFMLTYKQSEDRRGIPQAVVGLAAHGADELMIYQLQGVAGKVVDDRDEVVKTVSSRGLAVIDWRSLFIGLGEEVARVLGLRRIGIQGAVNNPGLTSAVDGRPCLSFGAAVRAYDIPASQAGFVRGGDNNWHKLLSPQPG